GELERRALERRGLRAVARRPARATGRRDAAPALASSRPTADRRDQRLEHVQRSVRRTPVRPPLRWWRRRRVAIAAARRDAGRAPPWTRRAFSMPICPSRARITAR